MRDWIVSSSIGIKKSLAGALYDIYERVDESIWCDINNYDDGMEGDDEIVYPSACFYYEKKSFVSSKCSCSLIFVKSVSN